MVDADDVAMGEGLAHSLYPPVIAGVLERLPVVERIAPALAGLAESVWRDAGNNCGAEIGVQVIKMRMRPDVSAVIADEDGDVADDLDAALRGNRPDGTPLLGKKELDDAMELQLFREFVMRFLESFRLPRGELARPSVPRGAVEALAQAGEEDEILQPPIILGAEALKTVARCAMRATQKFFGCQVQQRHLGGTHIVVIYALDFRGKIVQSR